MPDKKAENSKQTNAASGGTKSPAQKKGKGATKKQPAKSASKSGSQGMRFACEMEDMKPALAAASKAAGNPRMVNPSLSAVRLSVQDGELEIMGTDNHTTVDVRLPVSDSSDGVVLVSAKHLSDVVRVLSGEDTTMRVVDDQMRVTNGQAEFLLRVFPMTDYPEIAEPSSEGVLLEDEDFMVGIRQVLPAASTDHNRPVLCGVYVTSEGGMTSLVATDSYRLGLRKIAHLTGIENSSALVPATALSSLTKLVDEDTTVRLHLEDMTATFATESARIRTSLIVGEYPKYKTLIPDSGTTRCQVPKAALLDGLRRAQVMTEDNTGVRLHMKKSELTLSASTTDVGSMEETLTAETDGVSLKVSLNSEFLIDGVEGVIGDTVEMCATETDKPILLGGVDEPDYQYLIMPIRSS